jgi:hypothetical protein
MPHFLAHLVRIGGTVFDLKVSISCVKSYIRSWRRTWKSAGLALRGNDKASSVLYAKP